MAIRFRLLPLGIEGQYFKAAPEGWLFGAPGPWLTFRPRTTYLVTDAQRAMLAGRIRRSRYIRLLLAIPLAATTPLWMDLVRGLSLLGNTLLVFGGYLVIVHLLEHLMIRRLLTELPRASERMTMTDMLRQQSAAMSVRSQAILGGFFGFAAVLSLVFLSLRLPIEQDLLRYIALFSGFLCTLWLGMLLTRLWRPSHHRSDRSE
jgi:hypothetical protein